MRRTWCVFAGLCMGVLMLDNSFRLAPLDTSLMEGGKGKRNSGALSGATSPLRGSCHCCAMGRTEGSYPTKVPRKRGMQKHYFRDYFVAALLVPPQAAGRTEGAGTTDTPCGACALSGATSPLRGSCRLRRGEPRARVRRTLLTECVHFQGLLRPFGARAAFGGANRHPRTAARSPLLSRSDVVLVRSKYKEK